nr:MAG TPA: hypothetical protein [Bacteriophage sp.]
MIPKGLLILVLLLPTSGKLAKGPSQGPVGFVEIIRCAETPLL